MPYERVMLALVIERRFQPVPAVNGVISVEHVQLFDRFNQFVVIAAGEVASAYASIKQRIARKKRVAD